MVKKKITKITSVIMSALLTVQPVMAASPVQKVDETAYVTCDYYGKVSGADIVKAVYLNGSNEITDYGNYKSVKNLTTKDTVSSADGVIRINVSQEVAGDRFYYEVTPENKDNYIPFNMDVAYTLNGKPAKAEDLGGAKGLVGVDVSVTPKEGVMPYYHNNFAMIITVMADTDKGDYLVADGAQIMNAGTYKAALFAVLPGNSEEFHFEIGSEDFEMNGIIALMVPLTLSKLDMIQDIAEHKDNIVDASKAVNNTIDDVLDMVSGMAGPLNETAEGVDELHNALRIIDASYEGIHRNVLEVQAQVRALRGSLDSLADIVGNNSMVTHLKGTADGFYDFAKSIDRVGEKLENVADSVENIGMITDNLLAMQYSGYDDAAYKGQVAEQKRNKNGDSGVSAETAENSSGEEVRPDDSFYDASPEEIPEEKNGKSENAEAAVYYSDNDGPDEFVLSSTYEGLKEQLSEQLLILDEDLKVVGELQTDYKKNFDRVRDFSTTVPKDIVVMTAADVEKSLSQNMADAVNHLGQGASAAVSQTGDALNNLGQNVAGVINQAGGAIDKFGQSAAGAINQAGAAAEQLGQNVTDVINGANSAINTAKAYGEIITETGDAVMGEADVLNENLLKTLRRVGNLSGGFYKVSKELTELCPDMAVLMGRMNNTLNAASVTMGTLDTLVTQVDNTIEAARGDLKSGTRKSLNGMSVLLRQLAIALSKVDDIKANKKIITDIVDEEWERVNDELGLLDIDSRAEKVSFTSVLNSPPESLQIICRTKEIKKPAPDIKNGSEKNIAETGFKGVIRRFMAVLERISRAVSVLFE